MKHACARAVAYLLPVIALFVSCSRPAAIQVEAEPDRLDRTEFTARVENFFEYDPLRSGNPSQFLIHLTDLADGSPVEKAEVTLAARRKGSAEVLAQTTARAGKAGGIYVAEVTIPGAGEFDIEFHIKNEKLDERMRLSGFNVE